MRRRISRFIYKKKRRGVFSRAYIKYKLHENLNALAFPNGVYGWLMISGIVDHVVRAGTERKQLDTIYIEWQNHPHNQFQEHAYDAFLSAINFIVTMDRQMTRNVIRYARLVNMSYSGWSCSVDEMRMMIQKMRQ